MHLVLKHRSPKVLLVVCLVILIGLISVYNLVQGAAPAHIKFEAESYTSGQNVSAVTDSTASGGAYLNINTASTGTNTYPDIGSVGFKAATCPSGLQVIDSSATAPAGTHYDNGYLTVTGNNVTLNCKHIKNGLYSEGTGSLTVTNSIVEGGASWFIFYVSTGNTSYTVRNSTLRWRDGTGTITDAGSGAGVIQGSRDYSSVLIEGNDLSGMPDGIQAAGDNWIIRNNYIHKLARIGSYPNNTHNDGIQMYGGANMQILNNRIDLDGFDGVHQNGTIFFQVDSASSPKVIGNYLYGGGVVLRFEGSLGTGAIVKDNVFGPLDTSVEDWPYYYYANNGATIADWSNNCKGDIQGNKFTPCQPVSQ